MAISAINLGNSFTNANGSPVLSGFSSGLNTDTIITSLVSAQTSQVTSLQDQITVNNSKTSAFTSLQQILTQFQTAANALAAPQSPDSTTNLFAFRSSKVSGNTSQASSNYLSVDVSTLASLGDYTISNITSTAAATIQESSAFTLPSANTSVVTASATSGFFIAGTFTIKGQDITLTAGETLNQVVDAFNAVKSTTGIGATAIQTAVGVYKIAFTGTNTGLANAFDLSSNGTVTSGRSAVLGQLSFANDQTASDASFKFNGVTVARPTNSVSDIVNGVTFNILQNTNNETNPSLKISVLADTTSISNGITNFANAYNNFLTFYAKQTQIDSTTGQPAKTAILSNDTTLNSIYTKLTTLASSIVNGISGDNPQTLNDLGISFVDVPATDTTPDIPPAFSIDSTALQNALKNNLVGVENIFGYNATSSSSNLAVCNPPNDQTISDFKINVDQIGKTYTAKYTNSSGVAQTINLTKSTIGSSNAISLSAPSGSGLEGLSLIYAGGGSESNIDVSSINGISSQINYFLKTATDKNIGLIANEKTAIATKNTTTKTQIDNVNTQINAKKQQLLTKFSELEAAISKANSSLNYLNAQQSAKSSG
ncbi:MAG: flagellar filament capping protein FliD [Pseudomonadota bacterium]